MCGVFVAAKFRNGAPPHPFNEYDYPITLPFRCLASGSGFFSNAASFQRKRSSRRHYENGSESPIRGRGFIE